MGTHSRPATEVSSAEISRNFGAWQDRALDGPVVVTRHGRPRVVIVSAAEYAASETPYRSDIELVMTQRLETSLGALLNHMSEGFVALDTELRIISVNRVYEDLTNSCASQLVGQMLESFFPQMKALFPEQLRRTLRTGEPSEFEMASSIFPGRTYHIQTFPYPGGVAALLTSRAQEDGMLTELAEAAAVRTAMDAVLPLAVANLNVRGVFTGANPHFIALTGFSIEDLTGVRLTDIVRPSQRHAALDAIDACLSRGAAAHFETTILAKGSVEKPVKIGLAAILRDEKPDRLVVTVISS